MTGGGESGPGAPSDSAEETRYRSIRALDPAAPGAIAALLDALADASWRVRHVAAERLADAEPAWTVPALIATLGAESTTGRRHAAAEALVQVGAPAVDALVAALPRAAPEQRTALAEILGEIGDRRATSALTARLSDADANARIAAAEALGKIGGTGAVVSLQRSLLVAGDLPLRAAVLDALLHLCAPPPAPVLQGVAADPALVRVAMRLAGESDEPAAHEILARGLEGTRGVRDAALAGIGRQRLRRRKPAASLAMAVRDAVTRRPDLVRVAEAAAVAPDHTVRAGAVAVLEASADRACAPLIAAAGEDERVRTVAADALEAIGSGCALVLVAALPRLSPTAALVALSALARWRETRAFPYLVEAFGNEDEEVRGPAVEALGRLGDLRAIPVLMPLLDDADRYLSGAAIAALTELAASGSQALAEVREACRSHATPLPPAVYRLLGRIGAEDDAAAVRAGLHAPHRGTRMAAAAAVAALADRGHVDGSAVPPLLDRLADEDAAVRAAAAQALGSVLRRGTDAVEWGARRAEATRALAIALRDEDVLVRSAAALALGNCRATDYAGVLSELARDRAAPAEAAAAGVRALAALGHLDPEVLKDAAQHPDPEVVKEAVLAATAVPGRPVAELLLSAASHPRWDVRRAAAAALASRDDGWLAPAVRQLASTEQDALVREALGVALRALEARR